MTRYHREIAALPETYRRAVTGDIDPLARVIESLSTQALRVVGSGGSFSVAAFCARLHAKSMGQIASAATPLEIVHLPHLHGAGLLCLTASGRNRDIGAAFEAAALAETKPLAALCLTLNAPIKELASRFGFTDVVEADLQIVADGFLAVNSLLASCVLLARAYRLVCGHDELLPASFDDLMANVSSAFEADFRDRLRPVLQRSTVSVLYSPSVAAAATDLESRFVEGAFGNLHAADWRNFGHGRHHWIAKREAETGMLALVGDGDAALARKTLENIPETIPRAEARFGGPFDVQGICALVLH